MFKAFERFVFACSIVRQVYGITGKTLGSKMGALIPSEPSYVIFNTAMSSTWGFPEGETGCPKNCDCSCYNCNDPTGKCSCGFADGFCASLPGHFLVDYVRVYQNPNDGQQKVGCSTPERPTSRWIEGHASNYKDEMDAQPILSVTSGGGKCHKDADCGGAPQVGRGYCYKRRGVSNYCVCNEEYTGPFCAAHAGEDPVDWEPSGWSLAPFPPLFMPPILVSVATGLVILFLVTYFGRVAQVNAIWVGGLKESLNTVQIEDSRVSRVPSRELYSQFTPIGQTGKTYSMVKAPSEVQLSRFLHER
jgi:hypothetical protein